MSRAHNGCRGVMSSRLCRRCWRDGQIVGPDAAGMGAAPQTIANAASEVTRSGIIPGGAQQLRDGDSRDPLCLHQDEVHDLDRLGKFGIVVGDLLELLAADCGTPSLRAQLAEHFLGCNADGLVDSTQRPTSTIAATSACRRLPCRSGAVRLQGPPPSRGALGLQATPAAPGCKSNVG